MSDPLRRAVRTFLQAFTGVILLQVGAIMVDINQGTWVPDVAWLQRLLISAIAAGVIAVITWLHNWTEDHVPAVPALLKAPPSPGANPVPEDAGGP